MTADMATTAGAGEDIALIPGLLKEAGEAMPLDEMMGKKYSTPAQVPFPLSKLVTGHGPINYHSSLDDQVDHLGASFQWLTNEAYRRMKISDVSVDEIYFAISIIHMKCFAKNYVNECFEKANTLAKIWGKLNHLWDFFNYELFQQVVRVMFTKADDPLLSELAKYESEMEIFCSRTKFCDFVNHWPFSIAKPKQKAIKKLKKILVTVDQKWEDCTLHDAKRIFSVSFSLPQEFMVLKGACTGILPPSVASSIKKLQVLTMETLEKENKITDEQLDTRVEETDLPQLSSYFDNTDDYVEMLGLSPGQQTCVIEEKARTAINQTQAGIKLALKYWLDRVLAEGTFRALLLILISLDKGDIAIKVAQYLSAKGEAVVEVTKKSNEFSSFGIKITVPENSLPEGIDTCVLHISFELSTNFEIPANSELLSSIYRVKCEPKMQFKKPVTLEMQHCMSLNSDHQQRLVFARATDQSKKFEILEGGHFPIGERYGSIQLTSFSWFTTLCELLGYPTEKMYSALLFRNNLPCDVIDMKCVVCQDLDTHVKVIREALERDGFTKEMDLDQIQFENTVEMKLHSENPELWTVTRVTSTLSRDCIEGYSSVLDSNRRRGVIPAIHYRFNLKEKNISESVNFLLTKTDLESQHLILHICLPHTLGNSDSATQRVCQTAGKSDLTTQRGYEVSTSYDCESIVKTSSSASRIPLQDLIKRYRLTDKQLNSEIKKSDTPVIAHYFENVQLYSSAMELTLAEEADVKELRRVDGNQTAMMKCLQIWKKHAPSQATYRALLDIVLGLGEGNTAHQICQQFTRLKLSSSDKPYHKTLFEVAYRQGKNKWYNIGISLNVSVFDLESIRKNNPSDVGDCFRAMLLKWFESSPDCYLYDFLKALRSEPVELENLCPKVEEAILNIAKLGTASEVGGVGLQELMDHVDTVQLDREIPDDELPVIAAYFNNVELYSQAMGLTPAEQDDVRTSLHQYDTQTAITRCLLLWQQRDPYKATYRALLELLLRLHRTQVATQVCQYLAQNKMEGVVTGSDL
ncbi:uncharacterized protein LOC135335907 isoform X3 [Halichondria panicea]|uniref:uncharacterized protein LOC135335907 isoform X3 n=1 Tax=Halichondria panicea TaxID=6063 RepID=UPI00312B51D3